jgi:hypothetical protein
MYQVGIKQVDLRENRVDLRGKNTYGNLIIIRENNEHPGKQIDLSGKKLTIRENNEHPGTSGKKIGIREISNY